MLIIKKLKSLVYYAFRLVARPLRWTGIGTVQPVWAVYMYVLNHFIPKQPQYISVHGHKMLIHKENNKPSDGVGKEMIFWGVYNRYMTLLFEKFIGEGMNVIDVGAHIGYYSLLAARLAGDR